MNDLHAFFITQRALLLHHHCVYSNLIHHNYLVNKGLIMFVYIHVSHIVSMVKIILRLYYD